MDAGDLNPVAVLISKALVELPPKFSGRRPIGPADDRRMRTQWPGSSGLAEDVRRYSRWINDRARAIVGGNYPDVTVPPSEGAGRATVIAWIWARTIACGNPACGATMPLLNSFALSRRKNREAWLEPAPDRAGGAVDFKVRRGTGCPKGGTVTRSGATCLACGTTAPLKEVRAAAKAGGLGSQLVCTVAEGRRKRIYADADDEQVEASRVDPPTSAPTERLPNNPRAITTPNYGIDTHDKLFTARQLRTLVTFTDLVAEARRQVMADGGDEEYADAIATYLGLAIGRLANRGSSQSFWNPNGDKVEQVFARPALPMIWAYAEANPFSTSSGNFLGQVGYLANALSRVPAEGEARVRQFDARAPRRAEGSLMTCTDPPYYDNIPFADLSDFFYVWLRRCLKDVHPDLFSTILVPKADELIAEPARHDGWDAASDFFEDGLRRSFKNMLAVQDDEYPFTVFYAFKQAEDKADGAGRVSTGWERMLQGLIDAGAVITGTWPVRTEQPGGLREVGRAALASSIVLVCRRRPERASLTTRGELLAALRSELPEALRLLQQGNIAPVDLAQASIGPGMAVFSRYSKVLEADGSAMRVRTALAIINGVLDDVLASQEADLDGGTRWAVAWFEEFGLNPGSAGVAETLSKAKNTSIGSLVRAGILEQRGNRCRLLARGELDEDRTRAATTGLTVWEVVQHLMRTLEQHGEATAADLLGSVGGRLAEPARQLAYRLFSICEKKGWSAEALAYNGLVAAWPELLKLAARRQASGYQTSFEE